MSSAVPRHCKACGGDLRPPAGMIGGVWSTILADDGKYHYSCWSGPENRLAAENAKLRAALDEIAKRAPQGWMQRIASDALSNEQSSNR